MEDDAGFMTELLQKIIQQKSELIYFTPMLKEERSIYVDYVPVAWGRAFMIITSKLPATDLNLELL